MAGDTVLKASVRFNERVDSSATVAIAITFVARGICVSS